MITCLSETSTSPVSGSSLDGQLHLRCENRADGIPYISRQKFRAPIHIGKGHVDQGQLVLNIANPTAGFFDGDRVDTEVTVAFDARLVLSTPAAARVYQTRSGRPAANFQEFHVEGNASLEWIPEPFIPHAGANYYQATKISLHGSSSLLFFEWLAPGRVAKGEVFAYRNLRWELDLSVDGKLVARERYDLRPDNHSLEALRARFPAAHYLSVYAAGVMTRDWPADELDALTNDDTSLGHGLLRDGVHVIRALCRDSLAARKLLENLRSLLYSHAGLVPPALGRLP
jgi:urease accessory protein